MPSPKKVLIIILIALCCASLRAQTYIYPVATGTSWSQKVFDETERRAFETAHVQPELPNAPRFAHVFNRLYDNYQTHQLYEDSIFVDMPNREWIEMFARRARCYSQIYAENNRLIRDLRDYFRSPSVPDAAYDSLFYWTRHLYHNNMSDIFMLELLVDGILIPHYEKKADNEHLMFCYSNAGLIHYQCSRIGDKTSAGKSLAYFRKAVAMKDDFATFADPLNRYYFISSFVNLTVLHAQDGSISMKECRELMIAMEQLYGQEEVKRLLDSDHQLKEFAEWSMRIFSLRSIMTYISHKEEDIFLLQELYADYCAVRAQFGKNMRSRRYRYYAKLEYDDLIIEAYMGNLSWDKAYERFNELLKTDPELTNPKGMSAYRMNYTNNLFSSNLYIIDKTTMDDAGKSAAMKTMLEHMLGVIEHFEHIQFPFEKGQIMSNIATHPDLLRYLNTEEKRDLLYRLFVLEQPTTYVHVSMVADLASILTEALIDKNPEYFHAIPQLASPDTVRTYKSELVDFVHRAALFHDAGKIMMPTVVNNNYRALTDHEYSFVKRHPEMSMPFFSIDESFHIYEVIALGHHKWYNGGGYPESFDNVSTILFPIINIITICDCMDAATENVGRNYHTPKRFEDVMGEFVEAEGTRYDPFLVEFINSNSDVSSQMKQKVLAGRAQHYYQMYRRYLDD